MNKRFTGAAAWRAASVFRRKRAVRAVVVVMMVVDEDA